MRRVAAFALILLISSCSEEKIQKDVPDGILSKDSMAYHLSNVHLIDAAMRHRVTRKQSLQAQAKHSFLAYFDTSGVSQKRFDESLDFWRQDFEAMESIYDLSMERLSTKLAMSKQSESSAKEEAEVVDESTQENRPTLSKEEAARRAAKAGS